MIFTYNINPQNGVINKCFKNLRYGQGTLTYQIIIKSGLSIWAVIHTAYTTDRYRSKNHFFDTVNLDLEISQTHLILIIIVDLSHNNTTLVM